MTKEVIIYCDESVRRGRHFSNFYGGLLVRSDDIDAIRSSVSAKKAELGLGAEVKWNKISESYQQKYIDLMSHVFDLISQDRIKVRIMFTQNLRVPQNLTVEQIENEYFLLYYQFVKHAFGLEYCNDGMYPVNVRIFLDQLPDTKEKANRFRAYLCSLTDNPQLRRAKVTIFLENVTDAISHDHELLQCLDVILGSMQFRLNDKHLEKPPGSRIRGKRTRAKETVYQYISARIREIYPNFNIGTSTGVNGDVTNRWHHPYRHWLFVARDHLVQHDQSKRRRE